MNSYDCYLAIKPHLNKDGSLTYPTNILDQIRFQRVLMVIEENPSYAQEIAYHRRADTGLDNLRPAELSSEEKQSLMQQAINIVKGFFGG